jgi:hypothetical protein
MRQRGIPKEAVEAVLQNYHTSRPAPRRSDEPASVIYIGYYQGRDLKVYVERDTDPPKIRTAVWEGD